MGAIPTDDRPPIEVHAATIADLEKDRAQAKKLAQSDKTEARQVARYLMRLYDSVMKIAVADLSLFEDVDLQLVEIGVTAEAIGSIDRLETFCQLALNLCDFVEALSDDVANEDIKSTSLAVREYAHDTLAGMEEDDDEDGEPDEPEDDEPSADEPGEAQAE